MDILRQEMGDIALMRATSFTNDEEINDHSFDGIRTHFPVLALSGDSYAPAAFHIKIRHRTQATNQHRSVLITGKFAIKSLNPTTSTFPKCAVAAVPAPHALQG